MSFAAFWDTLPYETRVWIGVIVGVVVSTLVVEIVSTFDRIGKEGNGKR